MITCAGLSACGMEEGSDTRNPSEQREDVTAEQETEAEEALAETVTDGSEISENTAADDAEIGAEETETSGECEIQGQTYYNRSVGIQVTVPENWMVDMGESMAELREQHNVLFFAHTEDGADKLIILDSGDYDVSEENKRIMEDPDTYCEELLKYNFSIKFDHPDLSEPILRKKTQ